MHFDNIIGNSMGKAREPRKGHDGYFSVEAALVLPLVLGVYLFLIVTLFLQYDRCLLEQDMASMLIKAGNYDGTPQQRMEYLQELTAAWDREQYLWVQLQPPHFTIQGQQIQLEAAGEYAVPAGGGLDLGGAYQIEVAYRLNTWDRVMLARALSGRKAQEKGRG